MKLDIEAEVKEILDWNINITEEKKKVPTKLDISLGSNSKYIYTCILFVDVRGSSVITNSHRKATTAKILNAFLNGVVRIAKDNWGHVRSFNGDSVMVVFDPDMDNIVCTKAVDTALKIKSFVIDILLPQLKRKGYEEKFEIGIGVAKDNILVSKVGIRGTDNNDLIWTSTGTNFAAKMANSGSNIYISEAVLCELKENELYLDDGTGKKYIWSKSSFSFSGNKHQIYESSWRKYL